jgi:cold shock protein
MGFCKMWNHDKAYGFITGQDGTDYFCYYKAIIGSGQRKLIAGEEVEFDVETLPDGKKRAINVNRL